MNKQTQFFTVKRIALDAVLIALYVLLGFFKIPIGNILRVSLTCFPVIICALAFSPLDGLLVGFLGEFLSQVLGPYGLTPTTVLWSLPEAARGLLLGLCVMAMFRKMPLPSAKNPLSLSLIGYLFACVITGIVASLLNTLALYVDSKMYGYYNDYMVFGVLVVRLSMAVVISGIFGYFALPIISALRATHIIKEKKS